MAIKCIHRPLQSAVVLNEPASPLTGRVSRLNVDTFTRSNVNCLSVSICVSRPVKAQASLFPFSKKKDRAVVKEELLEAIAPLDRGANATPDDQYRVEKVTFLSHDSSLNVGNCQISLHYPIAESVFLQEIDILECTEMLI